MSEQDTLSGFVAQIGLMEFEGREVLRAIVIFEEPNAPHLTWGDVWERTPVRIVRAESSPPTAARLEGTQT
jgi:hypothetical protein